MRIEIQHSMKAVLKRSNSIVEDEKPPFEVHHSGAVGFFTLTYKSYGASG